MTAAGNMLLAASVSDAYAAAVLADSPLAYYRLGEASGATANDSSGNSRNASYVGSPTLGTAGLVGTSNTAATFNGSSTYAEVADAAWQDVTAITLEAVVKPNTVTKYSQLADRDPGSSGDRIFQFRISDTAKLELIWWLSASGPFFATGATSLVVNTAYHVAATFDGTTGKVLLNGVSDGTTSASGTLKTGIGAVRFGASNDAGAGSFTFSGVYDEAAYYGSALTAARLLDHAQKAGLA